MLRFLARLLFGQKKAQAFEIDYLPVSFVPGSERRWLILSDETRARLEAERRR